MVYAAAVALGGVCVLGLYLGIQPALERAVDANEPVAASNAPAMKPGMAAAVEAIPLKTETPPPSAAPASQLADAAKPKTKPSTEDATPASDDAADDNSPTPGRKTAPPEPPTLYSPDEAPAPAPAGGNSANTPPY
jgi:hypothetical protein